MNLEISDRSKLESAICGALAAAIHAHGPITMSNRASAAKRIYGLLKQQAKDQKNSEAKEVFEHLQEIK